MHEPVLVREVVELLHVRPGGTYIDATVGSGGHTLALLAAAGPAGRVLGLDRDADALERTRARLGPLVDRCLLAHGNYERIEALAAAAGVTRADGVLIDCGVSAEQLETAERGFSFNADGPLDMRMDRSQGATAADLVNGLPEEELAVLLRTLGEEPAARRIARAIAAARRRSPIRTTRELADIVARTVGGARGPRHPATRTFQALRLRVNRELEALAGGLEGALRLLTPGGRLAVISFHSLEDRLVKQRLRAHAGRWESLPAGGRVWRGEAPAVRLVTRRPVTPSAAETARNPRARSAKLRAAERWERELRDF